MGRGLFNSQNKIGETYRFPTNKNGTFYWYIDKHDPNQFPTPYGFASPTPTRNHRFDLGDGSQPVAPLLTNINALPSNSNTQSHTYSDGSDKWFTIETDKLDQVRSFHIGFSNVVNNIFTGKTSLDLTPFTKLYSVNFQRNTNITGATFNTDGTQPLYWFYGSQCDLSGTLDLSALNLSNINTIYTHNNTNLDEIIFPSTVNLKGNFYCYNCNLSGHYDFTGWSGVGSQFQWQQNNITGFTFPTINGPNGSLTNGILAQSNDLTGTLDLSPLKELGRVFRLWSNNNLTNIIFPSNTRDCRELHVSQCNLVDLDLSGVSGLTVTSTSPTIFRVDNNPLTAFTTTDGLNKFNNTEFIHPFQIDDTNLPFLDISGCTFITTSFPPFVYWNDCNNLKSIMLPIHPKSEDVGLMTGNGCNILTDLDISAFNINNSIITNTFPTLNINDCISLSGLTTPITGKTGQFHFGSYNCNLSGTLDLSFYYGLMKFDVGGNSNLTNLILPNTTSTQTLTDANLFGNANQKTFEANSCDLGYVDFKPMSGVTLNSGSTILLNDNNMTVGEVNHILDDFTSTTWSGVTLEIGGTNAAPDSSSGGYDGVAAIDTLTGVTRNWSITTS